MTEFIAGLGSRVWQTEAALNHYRLSMPMTVIKDSILDLLSDPIKGRVYGLGRSTKDGSLKDDEM